MKSPRSDRIPRVSEHNRPPVP